MGQLKGFAAAMRFHVSQAAGDILKPLLETWDLLQDAQVMEQLGMDVTFPYGSAGTFDEVFLFEQDVLAGTCGRFALHLIAAHVRGFAHSFCGFPWRCAALLSEDKAQVASCLVHMQREYDTWTACLEVNLPQAVEMRQRSHMQWPLNRYLFGCAANFNFDTVSPHLRAVLTALFGESLSHDKLVEDAFKDERLEEKKGQADGDMRRTRVWFVPVRQRLLSKTWGFDEVSHTSSCLQPGLTEAGLSSARRSEFPDPPETHSCSRSLLGDSEVSRWWGGRRGRGRRTGCRLGLGEPGPGKLKHQNT